MKTVKQVLSKDRELSLESDSKILESLVHLGLLESGRVNLVKRAMYTNTDAMTMAEKKSMIGLMESLITHVIHEKRDHLAALDTRRAPGYPSERDIPVVLILKRKALRVYPDNQKVAMYYSQALDKYISIPFGPQSDELGIHMNEETKEEMRKIKFGSHDTVEINENAPVVTFRNKLDSIREEREVDESFAKALEVGAKIGSQVLKKAVPLVKKGISTGSKIGAKTYRGVKAGIKGAGVLGASALQAVSDSAKNSDSGPSAVNPVGTMASRAGSHDFTSPGRATPTISKGSDPGGNRNLNVPTSTEIGTQWRLWGKPQTQNESNNLDVIRSIVQNDLKEDTVAFGDNRISINNRTAKKIIGIHESLNKTNQRKFEKMLNENAVSFRKAINFVVKVR